MFFAEHSTLPEPVCQEKTYTHVPEMLYFRLTSGPGGTNIHNMKCAYIVTALLGVTACVVQADSEETVCEALLTGLRAQVKLLAGVNDAAGAAAAVAPLQQNLAELAALNGRVSSDTLWLYIDNSQEMKQALIEELQRLAVQFSRLRKAEFYGCSELHAVLAPQLTAAEDAQ